MEVQLILAGQLSPAKDTQQERAQLTVEDGKLYTESWWVVLYILYYLR